MNSIRLLVRDFIDCITIEETAMGGCQTYYDISTTVLKIDGLGQHRGGDSPLVNVLTKGWGEWPIAPLWGFLAMPYTQC